MTSDPSAAPTVTADGWHMGTHAAALGGAVLAMRWSRRARDHEGFAFGGWKIEVLTQIQCATHFGKTTVQARLLRKRTVARAA